MFLTQLSEGLLQAPAESTKTIVWNTMFCASPPSTITTTAFPLPSKFKMSFFWQLL